MRKLAILAALLVLAVMAWKIMSSPTPSEIERKAEEQLQEQFPAPMEGSGPQGQGQHGSPLGYNNAGFTKLTHNDELLSCNDRARDGKALIGAMYDAQSRKWKACSDTWDPAAYPALVDWNRDAEFHITGTCKTDGNQITNCHYGRKKSWHRG